MLYHQSRLFLFYKQVDLKSIGCFPTWKKVTVLNKPVSQTFPLFFSCMLQNIKCFLLTFCWGEKFAHEISLFPTISAITTGYLWCQLRFKCPMYLYLLDTWLPGISYDFPWSVHLFSRIFPPLFLLTNFIYSIISELYTALHYFIRSLILISLQLTCKIIIIYKGEICNQI